MADKNKVISFWSPVSGVGVSMTAINVARLLAKKGLKVALFDYDLKAPSLHIYLRSEDSVHCLDNVIPFTAGGSLTPAVMESNMQVIEGIHLLRGTNSPEQAHNLKVESLVAVLEVAKQMFDYVIIDTQSVLDNYGTYVALENADKVFAVMEKNVVLIQHYEQIKNIMSQNFQMDKFELLVNKSHKDIYMDKQDIEHFFGIPDASELPLLGFDFVNAINQGKWVAFLNAGGKTVKPYNTSIEKFITNKIESDFTNMKEVKKSAFNLFSKK